MNDPNRNVLAGLAVVAITMTTVHAESGSKLFDNAERLIQAARTINRPKAKNEKIAEAEDCLQRFLKTNPEHSKAGHAHSHLGQIQFGKARRAGGQSTSTVAEATKVQHRQNARKLLTIARSHFKAAVKLHHAAWAEFPDFIDRKAEPLKHMARSRAEGSYIRVQFDLAKVTFEESQTYFEDADRRNELLPKAANEFGAIHARYRSQVVGLYARLWQGKCYQEQEDLRRAMSIYDELLSHSSKSSTLQQLKDQARHFQLICLNHAQRKDYQLVIAEATDWLKAARPKRTEALTGLGIRWELARAQHYLGSDPNVDATERERYEKEALQNARFIDRFPGRYREAARRMIRHLSRS